MVKNKMSRSFYIGRNLANVEILLGDWFHNSDIKSSPVDLNIIYFYLTHSSVPTNKAPTYIMMYYYKRIILNYIRSDLFIVSFTNEDNVLKAWHLFSFEHQQQIPKSIPQQKWQNLNFSAMTKTAYSKSVIL